ncbi:MAG TPA: cation-translocating P-type ATPase [Candidatus Binatia bacterium]|nr:cation-translocating P-type ATPase [Candidatus Binatia bacterium]
MLPHEEVRRLRGLDETEAAARLRAEGPNELPSARPRGLLALGLEVVREPMILLLVACGAVYLVLGDRQEAAILLASVLVVIGISLWQARKTERALEALRDLSSPRALVIRDGVERRVAGREVVRGDLVVLAEGDRVPADAVVCWARNLRVDESLLTGESVPVGKTASEGEPPPAPPGGDGSPLVWSGSLVVAGQGVARVRATGAATALGRIGTALGTVDAGRTRLERQVGRLVRAVAVAGAVVCAAVVLVYGVRRASWLEGALAGLALAISLVPEEFPVILTVFLALGAWRIARRHVLVRRMPALEALGAATVLCLDKTGTLTQNRMAVRVLAADGRCHHVGDVGEPLPEEMHRLLEYAVLASQENPFDPTERAIDELGRRALAGTEHLHRTWTLVREYPLSPELLAMSHVWRSPEGDAWIVAAKGAPEAIADLCHLSPDRARALAAETAALAGRGRRVLGVAAAMVDARTLPPGQHDFPFELLGLIGLADPLRPTAAAAVAECAAAGVRTVMITGDYPETARVIAAEVGLARGDGVCTGAELDAMDDAALAARLPATQVFARAVPEQKLRLVRALKARGEVVAMTGDGVNDAPALKAADIGIAMGAHGTDVAREAAHLVVLDDDVSSIAAAVRLGRRVYDNVRKGMAYVLAIHVPIAGVALFPVLFGRPLVLLPVHIVFLELIVDPACSVAFEAEPEEADVMRRPPRDPRAPLLERSRVRTALLQGVLALAVVCAVLFLGAAGGWDEAHARTDAFATLILANLGLILANRSTTRRGLAALSAPNPALWAVVGGALALLAVGLAVPAARAVLRFAPVDRADVALVAAAGVACFLGCELLKGAGGSPVVTPRGG